MERLVHDKLLRIVFGDMLVFSWVNIFDTLTWFPFYILVHVWLIIISLPKKAQLKIFLLMKEGNHDR